MTIKVLSTAVLLTMDRPVKVVKYKNKYCAVIVAGSAINIRSKKAQKDFEFYYQYFPNWFFDSKKEVWEALYKDHVIGRSNAEN